MSDTITVTCPHCDSSLVIDTPPVSWWNTHHR